MVFVADLGDGAILGFNATSNGDPAPPTVITGSNTGLSAGNSYFGGYLLAFDGIGNLYLSSSGGSEASVFETGANGNVMPGNALNAAGIAGIAFDSAGQAYVSGKYGSLPPYVDIFAKGASATATPVATISGANTNLLLPKGLAVDSNGDVYVINEYQPAKGEDYTYDIEIFATAAKMNGNITPSGVIGGSNTEMQTPNALAFDHQGRLIVSDASGSILIFAAGAKGNVKPAAVISGADTFLGVPSGVAVDENNNIWESDLGNHNGVFPQILEFSATATGDAKPIKQIYGTTTMIDQPYQIVFVPASGIMDAKSRRSMYGWRPTRR